MWDFTKMHDYLFKDTEQKSLKMLCAECIELMSKPIILLKVIMNVDEAKVNLKIIKSIEGKAQIHRT